MMVYEVIRSTSISVLEEHVCLKMAKGWIPQGGVSIDSDNWYYQAMVYTPRPTSEQIDKIQEGK